MLIYEIIRQVKTRKIVKCTEYSHSSSKWDILNQRAFRPLTRAVGAGMAMPRDSHRHSAVRGIRQAKPCLKNALHF
jgi:hypothetical protein